MHNITIALTGSVTGRQRASAALTELLGPYVTISGQTDPLRADLQEELRILGDSTHGVKVSTVCPHDLVLAGTIPESSGRNAVRQHRDMCWQVWHFSDGSSYLADCGHWFPGDEMIDTARVKLISTDSHVAMLASSRRGSTAALQVGSNLLESLITSHYGALTHTGPVPMPLFNTCLILAEDAAVANETLRRGPARIPNGRYSTGGVAVVGAGSRDGLEFTRPAFYDTLRYTKMRSAVQEALEDSGDRHPDSAYYTYLTKFNGLSDAEQEAALTDELRGMAPSLVLCEDDGVAEKVSAMGTGAEVAVISAKRQA